jgi:enoyl-CoA hydratase/carnithine racemase
MSKTNAVLENDPILLREDDGVIATLTLNRPEKFNALSIKLMDLIQKQLDELAADNSIRVVIIAANGSAFCAGHDLLEMDKDPSSLSMGALFDQCSKIMISLTQLPQPIIAKVQGMATAAGCQLVAQCDLAIAAEDAQFATSGINIGLFCGTPMVALTRNLPRKKAMEMLLTGEFINAPTAVQYGLINSAVALDELDKSVQNLAETIAKQGPAFVAAGKKLFYRQIENNISNAYQEASRAMVKNMQQNDARKGIKASLGKRDMPLWEDR